MAGADGPFAGGNATAATRLLPNTDMCQVTDVTLDRLDGYMDNLYLSSMAYKGFTERLVRQLEKLATNNTTLATNNKNLVGDKNASVRKSTLSRNIWGRRRWIQVISGQSPRMVDLEPSLGVSIKEATDGLIDMVSPRDTAKSETTKIRGILHQPLAANVKAGASITRGGTNNGVGRK